MINVRSFRSIVSSPRLLAAATVAVFAVAASPAGATFPGANGKIAFASSVAGGYDIFTMNSDGSKQINLTQTTGLEEFQPAWSPDATTIAYASFSNPGHIYTMRADGTNQTQLTFDQTVEDLSPTWTPDGASIAFIRLSASGQAVYIMDANGDNVRLLFTSPTSISDRIQFSPDGTKIVYARYTGVGYSIFVRDANGSNETQVTPTTSALDLEPSWSPDSTRLIFASDRDTSPGGLQAIYVVNADGSGSTRLTAATMFGVSAVWSPNGSRIAFTNNVRTPSQVWTMNADGSGMKALTKKKTNNITPDWGRSLP